MSSTLTVVLVCFEAGAPPAAVARHVLKGLGLSGDPEPTFRWHAPGVLTVHLDRPVDDETVARVAAMPGVARTVRLSGALALARRRDAAAHPVALSESASVGGDEVAVIAGPCSVESRAQVCEIAALVKEAGAVALRGGVFKPRTSPYSFGGLGERGLEHLAAARERTGLPVVTEALEPDGVDLVARYADAIQIGSRNMQCFPLLFRAGHAGRGRPVLLKRSFGATAEEALHAAEYVLLGQLASGTRPGGVILCERGIRTFEDACRFTLDVAAIPVLKERTHLPVIADPSHPAGLRRYVPALSRAAIAAGADGLLVEVHTDPDASWCDGPQALSPQAFREMMADVREIRSIGRRRAGPSPSPSPTPTPRPAPAVGRA